MLSGFIAVVAGALRDELIFHSVAFGPGWCPFFATFLFFLLGAVFRRIRHEKTATDLVGSARIHGDPPGRAAPHVSGAR